MHANSTFFVAALAAAANAAPPGSGLPKLPGLPKTPGLLPKPPTPPTTPKTPRGDRDETTACTYNGTDDGKFDYSAVSLREVGARNTLDWRIWLLHKCKPISFWHDVCFSVLMNAGWNGCFLVYIVQILICSRHYAGPSLPVRERYHDHQRRRGDPSLDGRQDRNRERRASDADFPR